jgi:hypothetical protein
MNPSPNTPPEAETVPAPVAVVVIPATGLTDELRRYLELERDTIIAKLRMIDRLLGRPQTVPTRQR